MHRVQIQDSFESANGSVATRQLLQTQPADKLRAAAAAGTAIQPGLRIAPGRALSRAAQVAHNATLDNALPSAEKQPGRMAESTGLWDLRGRRPGKHSHRPPVGRATALAGQPNSNFTLDIRGLLMEATVSAFCWPWAFRDQLPTPPADSAVIVATTTGISRATPLARFLPPKCFTEPVQQFLKGPVKGLGEPVSSQRKDV